MNDILLQYPNSNQALHQAHRAWVPRYHNPYYITLTFARDVSEQFAREKYSQFVIRLSKRILKNACTRHDKLVGQHGYLEYAGGGYHIHTLIDVYENWDSRFKTLVRSSWPHGIVKTEKIPVGDLAKVQDYNSKRKTKQTKSGYYSDAFLIVAR